MEEMEELNIRFPPLQLSSRGPAGQAISPPEAANTLGPTLRKALQGLNHEDGAGGEENIDPLSPLLYGQVTAPMYESDEQEQEPNHTEDSPEEAAHYERTANRQHPACVAPWINSDIFCGGPGICEQCANDHIAYELMYSQLTRVQQKYSAQDPATLSLTYRPGACERCTETRVPGRRACVFHIFENYFRATHRLNADGTAAAPLRSLCHYCLRLLGVGEEGVCNDCRGGLHLTSRIIIEERDRDREEHSERDSMQGPEEIPEEEVFVPVRVFL
ncbi:hypothetical protein DFP73DRAFT_592025 [Morchella snyderi]|nr:hypothetical protein DFP73DRAFT_592025 [Morchella snyderi]